MFAIFRSIGGEAVASKSNCTNFLHCDSLQSFWFSWNNGNIRVGRGLVIGIAEFMKYEDPDPYPVFAVSMTTVQGVDGMFEWLKDAGE